MSVSNLMPIEASLKEIKPLEIKMVRKTSLEPLWDSLVSCHHYLGHKKMPGAQLKVSCFLPKYAPCSPKLSSSQPKAKTPGLLYRLVCLPKRKKPNANCQQ